DEESVDEKSNEKLTSQGAYKDLKQQKSVVEEKKEEKEKLPDAPFSRLIKMNAPEWHFILLGCFSSIFNGGVQPAFSVIFSRILGVFAESEDEQEYWIRIYSLILVGLGVISLITFFLQGYMFGRSGEALTRRLREMTFKAMLKQ
ncbi:multidrug resistance protein 1A, partial [Biomphalaria glabrata]